MISLPSETIFYDIERAIKTYRRFAQKQLSKHFQDITVDQAIVLLHIDNNSELSQGEIGDIIFKDRASVTRMIELLSKNKYLERAIHETDRRKFELKLTDKGTAALSLISKIVSKNRTMALEGVDLNKLEDLKHTLLQLITNCNSERLVPSQS